jgi:hypothetical protein
MTLMSVLVVGCGGSQRVDAGTGGGFAGFGGGSFGGGGALGGGTAVGGGGATETWTFEVVTAGGAKVPAASVRLSGPSLIAAEVATDGGVVTVSWPSTERPFDLTVAAPGYEAVSVLGLTNELPKRVRIDKLTFTAPPTHLLRGTITGRSSPSNAVIVDLYDGETLMNASSSWTTRFSATSLHPLKTVAFEVDGTGHVLNWDAVDVASRTADATVNFVFNPGAAVREARLEVLPADGGVLAGASMDQQELAHWRLDPVADPGYLVTGTATKTAPMTVTLSGVDQPVLIPNRLHVGLATATAYANLWVTNPFDVPSVRLPTVAAVTSSGTNLGNVAATATADGFDTLVLQVSTANGTTNTTYWRCYTAPGAPLRVRALPTLPPGITPAMVGITTGVRALPMLVRFASPATRPWELPGGDTTSVLYEATVAGPYLPITPDWR